MASLATLADAIRSAVTSTQTCTPTTSATLKELLQGKEAEAAEAKPAPKSRTTKTSQPAGGKTGAGAKRGAKAAAQDPPQKDAQDGVLAAREKAVLATHVINATLKALGEAAKNPPAATSPADKGLAKAAARNSIRRSNTMPMTPLQPRSLNRVSTSPAGATKKCRTSSTSTVSTGCLATVECARVALMTLRSLSGAGKVVLPELQLESGMSAFIAKLISLRLYEHALKEIRILKRRLEAATTGTVGNKGTKAAATAESGPVPKTLADLFDYPVAPVGGPKLALIISTQLQALRIFYGLKKSAHLDAALPFLRANHPSSPLNLLLLTLKEETPDRPKCAKQLEHLAQSMLCLTPNISEKDDGIAVEPRLSASPETALETQALALTIKLQSWELSGHKGDVDKDILFPLSRCMSAFTRRSSSEASSKFNAVDHAFAQVWPLVETSKLSPSKTSKSPLAASYQVLGSTAREAGNVKEATRWIAKLRESTDPIEDSPAKCCSVASQLLALLLKQSAEVDEKLVAEVLGGLQGPLSGNTTELDDLLVSICQARKAAMSMVLGSRGSSGSASPIIAQIDNLLFQLPRFALRWLGKPTTQASSAKDILRFEQRRQLLSKYIRQILDSALLLTKIRLEDGNLEWDLMDSMFQDSLAVLENMGNTELCNAQRDAAASYHVKISHFYYQRHMSMRKETGAQNPQFLRALRRSIDSVKQRSDAERAKAQVLMKQERLAELCRAFGRKDDAADALRAVRDTLVREGTVSSITAALSTQPLAKAWGQIENAGTLSRTVFNLAKLDYKPCDWTWLVSGLDKATALEHDLFFIFSANNSACKQFEPSPSLAETLLQHYTPERYPLRRLRTLLQLLIVNIHIRDEANTWMDEAKAMAKELSADKLGEDSGLSRYTTDLQASTACIAGLFDEMPDSIDVREALAHWGSVVASCQSPDDLLEHIENPTQLLSVLQSLADFLRLKGFNVLLATTLELSSKICQFTASKSPEALVAQNTALCLQHLVVGHSSKAEMALDMSREALESLARLQLSHDVVADFHLGSAEYNIAVGNFDKAERHLADAQRSATLASSDKTSRRSRTSKKISLAHAAFLHSMLALERGDSHYALRHAKNAVRTLYFDWAKLEELRAPKNEQEDGLSKIEPSEDSSFDGSRSVSSDVTRAKTGPEFWALISPLLRSLLRLSSVYAHIGLYSETLYYAGQAQKVAESTMSATYTSQSKAWLAAVAATAEQTQKALGIAEEVRSVVPSLESTVTTVGLLCQLGRVFRDVQDFAAESDMMDKAESMLESLGGGLKSPGVTECGLEPKVQKLTLKGKPSTKAAARPAKATKAASKPAPKKPAVRAAKAPVEVEPPTVEEDAQLSFVRASLLQYRSALLLDKKEWTAAVAALQVACGLSKLSSDISQERLLMAIAFIGQSLEQMGRDSVFSVIQDSTLSFPAIAGASKDKANSDRTSIGKLTPPRKGRVAAHDMPSFQDNLRQAQDCLLEAHATASLNGNNQLVHQIAALLQNAHILLSTTSPSRSSGVGHAAHATCSMELARNLTWRRERKILKLESINSKGEWPMLSQVSDSRRSSLGFSIDMNRFQKEYVDIIPKSWDVVSVSLSENRHDLCITKLQAGHSPFAIRLPLERASSRDADTEVLNFHQGRSEMLDIREAANRSCHDARDMRTKAARATWWAEREAIDERLKDLLEKIEQTWLGGFKGIFAQHHKRSDLLARFQKSFQNVLNKHLPSRRQVRGRRAKTAPTTRVTLDPRILDLFIGLGDATAPACDLDEPLTDLLYFVVDILQFHGERNAYDEIDFDAMVVETFDALHSYHAAAKSSKDGVNGVHTILVLDKALHMFPWESLPCMHGLAISRIPSLACLRRSILEQQAAAADARVSSADDDDSTDSDASAANKEPREGHYVSPSSGTYMLNPGGDLKNTQKTFGAPLSTLPAAWTSIETRAPTEAEFEAALAASPLLLYFGHGSGAQYIRGRTVRQLNKCRAVALLMGCSSAALPEAGGFEPSGTAWNYMLAGSPAVVGTLWDVTDRDIDRYAGCLFEEWGLMPRGTFAEEGKGGKGQGKGEAEAETEAARGKGKGKEKEKAGGAGKARKKATAAADADGEVGAGAGSQTSLVEAVAASRSACRFRYLTAAAVCVYGIPVYLGK